jgi:RimJ/RimL family protein N-acetyltransferase
MEVATRLLPRELTPDDERAFAVYQADPRYREFYVPGEATATHALLRLFAGWASDRPRTNYQLAVGARRPAHALLGCCGLRGTGREPGVAELGIELALDGWGLGHAHEAARMERDGVAPDARAVGGARDGVSARRGEAEGAIAQQQRLPGRS